MSFAIYKPLKGYDIDDAVLHITKATASLERTVRTAIVKSVNGSWGRFSFHVAVISVWKDASINVETDSITNLHGLSAELACKDSTPIVRIVDSGWFQLSSQKHKDIAFSQLKVGNIVNVRRIYSSRRKQDMLAYSCLAIMKAYFKDMKGICSYSFYKSIDGKRIIGLGIWDSIESASALLEKSTGSPGEAYWKGLGAKMLKYEAMLSKEHSIGYLTFNDLPTINFISLAFPPELPRSSSLVTFFFSHSVAPSVECPTLLILLLSLTLLLPFLIIPPLALQNSPFLVLD
eukprot:Gb_06987 [translate_table: standard]